jgi:protein-tyrosine phosphatase
VLVIDLHVHVLPAVDDGPATLDDAVALVAAASQAGTRVMAATSHVSGEHPNGPARLAAARAELEAALAGAGVGVTIAAGAEIAIERLPGLSDADLDALSLGGGPYLLVESPLEPSVGDIEGPLLDLLDRGRRIVLAHPERSPVFQRDPRLLGSLSARGAYTSVTAASFTGRFGKTVRRFTERLLEEGLVHNVASDGHDLRSRSPVMTEGLERVTQAAGAARTRWFTEVVPEAILAGAPVPAPPRQQARPRGMRRLIAARRGP